jgi:hypothetical protein
MRLCLQQAINSPDIVLSADASFHAFWWWRGSCNAAMVHD